MAPPHLKVHDSHNAQYENSYGVVEVVYLDYGHYCLIDIYCSLRPVPKTTYDYRRGTCHVLEPSHSHLCGYEDFSNASVEERFGHASTDH